MDVIWQWLGRDWAQIGGWSLFLGLVTLLTVLLLNDKLISGKRLAKIELRYEKELIAERERTSRALTSAETSAAALDKALEQNRTLTDSQSLFNYVVQEFLPASPKRGAAAGRVGATAPEGTPRD